MGYNYAGPANGARVGWPASLWDLLELDAFWRPRLLPSRKGTRWLNVLKLLVAGDLQSRRAVTMSAEPAGLSTGPAEWFGPQSNLPPSSCSSSSGVTSSKRTIRRPR